MELTELVFTARTEELERASKILGGLATDLSNLNKVSKEVAQTEATLAKAAKANADANLQNAKAQDVRLKSTIAADKADQSTEKAVKKSTEATERHTRAVKANADILAYQTDRAKFMAEGFSSGNASTLAQAKAVGQLSDELKKILDLQRSFQGNISFDKSDMGIKRLTKSYNEATESQKLFAEGTSLTIEQARELSRDQNRIAASMKFMGKSMDEITAAQRVYANEYNNVASAYNRIDAAEKAVIKQRKEVVSATNYVTQADQKMAAALNVSNVGLDRASSDSLVKYETALRKSGVAQDVLTTKLATYKTQLSQVQAQEQKSREQHLARALSPQLTDIGVSLYSGQAPLTVLLQQSGQIVDLFKLSGVEAQNFGKAMRESFYSMVPAISTVAKGMASLVTGMVVDAGSAFTGFIGKITGITAATEVMKRAIASGGEENFKYISTIQKMGTAFSALAGAGIFGLIALLGSIAIGLKQVIAQENELNRAVALSGGAMGVTADIANTYVARLGEITGNSTKANEAMVAMAKAGNITSSSVMMVGEAAIALNKAMGTPIEETVKQFDKLATAPGKTLIEIAKATGLISAETVELVLQYERAGESAKAAELAQKAYASATKSAAASVKENYGTLTTFAMGVSTIFSKMWDSILGVGRSDNLDTRIDQLRERIAENAKATPGLFLTQERIDQNTKDLNMQFYALVQQRQELMNIGKQKEQNVKATKAEEELDKLRSQAMSSIEKHEQEITRLTNYKLQLKKDGLLTDKAEKVITTAIAAERKKINDELRKNKDKKTESFFESSMKTLRNNTVEAAVANDGLVESQVKLLQIIKDPAFAKMTEIQKIQIMQAGAAAIATEQQAEAVKQLEKAEEFRLKVLGKSEGVGKQYYSDMEALMKYAKTAGWTTEQVEEMTRAIYMQTPAWKEHEKALESSRQALNKFNEESIAYQDGTAKTNEELDYRISLLGKTSEQQKILSIEYQREQKLRENAVVLGKKLRDIEEDITKAKRNGLSESELKKYEDAKVQAIQDSAERERAINRETAVVYAEDLQKEIDAIKSGISDSIVTALFEGGKEGSKKLRQVLVDTLRKKVTIVVDAVVNTLLGNVVGSLFGGASGAAGGAGGLLGNAASSALGSAASSALGIGTASSLAGGFSGTILPAGMVGPSVAAPTLMSGLGNSLAAIPGWGWAIAGIAALASIFTKKATPHMGAASTYSAAAGVASGAGIYAGSGLADTRTYNAEVEKVTGSIAQTLGQTLDATAKSFGKSAGFEISTAFADDTSKDGAWGSLVIKQMGKEVLNWADTQVSKWAPKEFADGEEGMKQYMQAIALSAKDALIITLKDTDWAKDMLNALGDNPTLENLGQVVQQINLAKAALVQFSKNMPVFANLTDSAASAMVNATGSMGNLLSMLNSYYDNFYTAEEKRANVIREITSDLNAAGAIGITEGKVGSTTRDEFRKYYESIVAAEGAASPLAIALLKVSSAFAEISQTTEEANQVISDSFARENEILRLTGQEVLAVSRERAKELAALDPTNKALQERIYALQDEQIAAEKASVATQTAAQAHEELIRVLTEIVKTALQILDNAIKKEKEVAKNTFDALMKDIDNRRNITVKAFEAQKNMLTTAIEGANNLANLLKEEANRIRGYATGMKLASNPTDILGGALSAQARLRSGDTSNAVLEAATNIDPEMFATWADYATNFFATQGIISDFADKADRQVSEAVSQVALLEHQLELTELQHQSDLEHYTKLEEAAKLSLEAQIAYYDSILEIANMQLEEALGTKLAVMALGDAMNNFSGAIADLSMATRNKVTSILPPLSGLPSFDVGTNYVPNNMIAQIHKGEAIIPAAYNPAASGSLTSEEVVNVLIEIKNVLVNTQNVTIDQKQSSDKLVRLIDSVTEGGQGMINAE